MFADILSDYPQTAVRHIVRTRHLYFAQRDTTPACFEPFVTIFKLLLVGLSLGGADIIFILSDGSDSGLDTAGNVL